MPKRIAKVHRKTSETDIFVEINLDGSGKNNIDTGIKFLDHMLELFAKHGLMNLIIKAKGDIDVDYHHTFEDLGICLGSAVNEALGRKVSIKRYGFSSVPMDEVLSQVEISLDISGRPYLDFNVESSLMKKSKDKKNTQFRRKTDVELTREFFKGFVNHAKVTMHIDLLKSGEVHHINESIFKAAGVALREAVSIHKRASGVSSTKGSL